jgi:hypothetical protein
MIKTLVLNQIVNGFLVPNAGQDVTICDTEGNLIVVAVESPSNSGNYKATYDSVDAYGTWYVNGINAPGYSNNSPFFLGISENPLFNNAKISSSLSTEVYSSGFGGEGFKLDNEITEIGKTSLTLDNLTVRDTMNVYELMVNQIRATNGALFVTDSAKVATVTKVGSVFTLTFDKGNNNYTGHPFAVGDLLRSQRYTPTKTIIRQVNLTVDTVPDIESLTCHKVGSLDDPIKGDDLVRIGSSTDPARRGTIYLTADDTNSPYIDVKDGVISHASFATLNKTKVRLGDVSGITSPIFGVLSGYGLYASGNLWFDDAHINGAITMTNQGSISIAGFNNDAGFITSGSAGNKTTYSSTAPPSPNAGDIWFNTSPSSSVMKRYDGGSWDVTSVYMDGSGLYAGTVAAGKVLAGTLEGFIIQTTGSGKRIVISSTDNEIHFYDATDAEIVRIGSSVYGIDSGIRIYNGTINIDTTTTSVGVRSFVNIAAAGTVAFYAQAIGGTVNYSFYGDGGIIYNADDINIISGKHYKINNIDLSYTDVGAAAVAHTHAATDITSATLPSSRGGTGVASLGTNDHILVAANYGTEIADSGHTLSTIGSTHNHTTATSGFTVTGALTATADITANYSDARLKKNLIVITDAIDKINQLYGYHFTWNDLIKDDRENTETVGLIAQEVEKVLPEAVWTGEDGYKRIYLDKITPLLVEGIKELNQKIKSLERRIEKLEISNECK